MARSTSCPVCEDPASCLAAGKCKVFFDAIVPPDPDGLPVVDIDASLHWPMPVPEMEQAHPLLLPAAMSVIRLLFGANGEASPEEANARHKAIVAAAADAFGDIQAKIEKISEPGNISGAGIFAAITALLAMYLATNWKTQEVSSRGRARMITSGTANYAHMIAWDLYNQIAPGAILDPDTFDGDADEPKEPKEPSEAEKLAAKLRGRG